VDAEQEPTTPQVRVIAGGTPTPEELAALVVALTPTGGGQPAPRGPAPWRRAAMLEGIGARRPTSPADIDVAALRG
jgi:hypothetical protein